MRASLLLLALLASCGGLVHDDVDGVSRDSLPPDGADASPPAHCSARHWIRATHVSPVVIASDSARDVYVWGAFPADAPLRCGGAPLGNASALVKMSGDGNVLWTVDAGFPDLSIAAGVPHEGGFFAVARSSAQGWIVATFDGPTGARLGTFETAWDLEGSVDALSTLGSGRFLATGTCSNASARGACPFAALPPGAAASWVAAIDAHGTVEWAHGFVCTPAPTCAHGAVATSSKDGRVLVVGESAAPVSIEGKDSGTARKTSSSPRSPPTGASRRRAPSARRRPSRSRSKASLASTTTT